MARHNLLPIEDMLSIAPEMGPIIARNVREAEAVKKAAPMWSLNLSSGSGVVKGRIVDAKVIGFRETRCYRSCLFEVTIACDMSDCKTGFAGRTFNRSFKVRRLPNV
jgi:hypothetical protein